MGLAGAPELSVRFARLVARHDEHAGYALSGASRLDIAWIRACLDDPASWRFDVAEAAIGKDWPAEPER